MLIAYLCMNFEQMKEIQNTVGAEFEHKQRQSVHIKWK